MLSTVKLEQDDGGIAAGNFLPEDEGGRRSSRDYESSERKSPATGRNIQEGQRQADGESSSLKENPSAVTTTKTIIGYAVVITGCAQMRDKVEPFPIAEGAAVLKHSIHRASAQGPYGYQLYAIYHPDAVECASTLAPLGFTLLERPTPVPVEEIQGDFLRERIVNNGCCGEKELIKFEAYTLTQHEAVVLLDLDALILKPLDAVFDLMLHGKLPASSDKGNMLMWPDKELPSDIQVLHTIDYAMTSPGRPVKPFQGGFAVLRPNRTVYEEFVSIIRKGDFRDHGGWGGKTGKKVVNVLYLCLRLSLTVTDFFNPTFYTGKFWGGQTYQVSVFAG
jgi:hypothetical protein